MSAKVKNIVLISMVSLFIAGFFLWSIFKPCDERSVSERRNLAQFPEMSTDNIVSGKFMTDFESFSLDQFPLRNQFRTIKAFTSFYVLGQKDNSNIYVSGGYASKLEFPINYDALDYAAGRFSYVYDSFLKGTDSKVYVSVIPDKNMFLAGENGYPSMDYNEFSQYFEKVCDFAQYIDIMPQLEISDYYATDTHWRQEKIVKIADFLSQNMGVKLDEKYTEKSVSQPFYGVYYGQSALPLPSDTIKYLDSEMLESCTVYDYETAKEMPVYDLEKCDGDDPYEMFLGGSKSLITIENKNAKTDKELIIFRDSFGSSLAPLLAEGYSKITLVDIRYISPSVLDKFIDFNGQDVLFIYSTLVLNNSITIK